MEAQSFGRYRLMELLGRGSMGDVYRAHDEATDRIVALKVLATHLAQDLAFQRRFRREAAIAASISDPHVVPIHSYGEIDGRLYLDMRLVEGRDLGSVIAETGPLEPTRAVRIVEQVAEALTAAHSKGMVHRDIKPSNILLARHDFTYLIDFGIAWMADQTRMTSVGSMIGTFAYMAPERFDNNEAEPRWDVYALACVLHECLTGATPFSGTSLPQQVAAHLTAPPPRPSEIQRGVPRAFDAVIATGMAKDPSARHQSALALAAAARSVIDAEEAARVAERRAAANAAAEEESRRAAQREAAARAAEQEAAARAAAEEESRRAAERKAAAARAAERAAEQEKAARAAEQEEGARSAERERAALFTEERPLTDHAAADLAPTEVAKRPDLIAPKQLWSTPSDEQQSTVRRKRVLAAAVVAAVLVLAGGFAALAAGGDTEAPATPASTVTSPVRSAPAHTTAARTTTASANPTTTRPSTTPPPAPPPAETITASTPAAPPPTFTPVPEPVITQAPVVTETQAPPPPTEDSDGCRPDRRDCSGGG